MTEQTTKNLRYTADTILKLYDLQGTVIIALDSEEKILFTGHITKRDSQTLYEYLDVNNKKESANHLLSGLARRLTIELKCMGMIILTVNQNLRIRKYIHNIDDRQLSLICSEFDKILATRFPA